MRQFEQLRKQKDKAKKSGASKKSDEPQEVKEQPAGSTGSEDISGDTEKAKAKEEDAVDDGGINEGNGNETEEESQLEEVPKISDKPLHHRQPSLSVQSKMRSSSFRRSSLSQGPLSPSINRTQSPDLPVLSPDGESVNSIYRKQAHRLDELEKDNRRLVKEVQDLERKWKQTEEELEELREASGDVAALKDKAKKADAQMEELNKTVRQLCIALITRSFTY